MSRAISRAVRVLPWAVLAPAVLAVSYAALISGHRVDAASAERYGQKLETMLALNIELSAEVLKTRSGLVGQYDGLVRTLAASHELHRALRQVPGFLPDSERKGLLSALSASEHAGQKAAARVERFKTENAVLRNSLLYLPVAAAELDAFRDETHVERELKAGASALVRDVLLLRLFPDPAVMERVARRIGALATESAAPGSVRAPLNAQLALVLSHAQLARAHAPVVDQLVREIVAEPAVAHTEALLVSYDRKRRVALARESRETAILSALVITSVLSAAAHIIARLRLSALRLARASEQLKLALTSLRAEQAKQRELSELKTRFVAMTSHEFRSPLSVIMSSTEMLAAYDLRWSAAKKAEHFARMRGAVLGMTRMLDAILLIGRSDAGKLEFKPSQVDLARLCNEILAAARRGARPEHRFVLETADADEIVLADESLLRHVLENLLSNAIKYSPAGGRIDFRVFREGAEVVFDVRDEGIGIPSGDRERLFEVFHRGQNTTGVPGSGLGLSVVKRALDLHGGTVAVESALGVGTCFTVRVPCPRSAA